MVSYRHLACYPRLKMAVLTCQFSLSTKSRSTVDDSCHMSDIGHWTRLSVAISVNNGNCHPWGTRDPGTGDFLVVQAAEKAPPVSRLLEGFSSDRQACRTPLVHVPIPPP